jgi:hypothetical protein
MATRGRPKGISNFPNKAELKLDVAAWIASSKPLAQWCALPGHPSAITISDWQREDPDFALAYARARDAGYEIIAQDCMNLIDTEPLAVHDDLGNKRYDPGSISWRKNQTDVRLRLLACWDPKKYGSRQNVTVDDSKVEHTVSFDIFGELLKNMALKRQSEE